MTARDVRGVVLQVASKTFQIPVEELRAEMTPADVENWDSLAQIDLILELEESFGIVIGAEDAFRIITIESIVELVEEKL